MSYFWQTYDDGRTIVTIGSEDGKIFSDEENTFGARITLEGQSSVAPASITIGVYGLLVHTYFYESIEEGKSKVEVFKKRIENLIAHYLIEEKNRDLKWNERHADLIDIILTDI